MQCYNYKCKEECNDLKIQYCISRVNKEQFQLKKEIGCSKCGSLEVKARYKKERVYLCTVCGSIRGR